VKRNRESLDFETAIGRDGKIDVPEEILHRLAAHGGSRVRVRLIPAAIAAELERRNVTPEEVERIASVQLESPEQVISFLLAEGVLAPRGGTARRAKGRTP